MGFRETELTRGGIRVTEESGERTELGRTELSLHPLSSLLTEYQLSGTPGLEWVVQTNWWVLELGVTNLTAGGLTTLPSLPRHQSSKRTDESSDASSRRFKTYSCRS